jgi:hypothetical protein
MQITGLSEPDFRTLRGQLLLTHEAQITGDKEGTISGHGVTADYRYDAASQMLSVDIVHRPFYVPVSAIESELRQAVARLPKAG